MPGFGIWHGLHQEPQIVGYQVDDLLSFQIRKGSRGSQRKWKFWSQLLSSLEMIGGGGIMIRGGVGMSVVTNEYIREAGE